jgi:hypothetical protein
MSFGNRTMYASLKDAYGIVEFEKTEDKKEFQIIPEETAPQIVNVVESFDEPNITCESVNEHCKTCGCMNTGMIKGPWLNEILNLLLVGLLLWILIYRPNI